MADLTGADGSPDARAAAHYEHATGLIRRADYQEASVHALLTIASSLEVLDQRPEDVEDRLIEVTTAILRAGDVP